MDECAGTKAEKDSYDIVSSWGMNHHGRFWPVGADNDRILMEVIQNGRFSKGDSKIKRVRLQGKPDDSVIGSRTAVP
jgi:hypothetical protein